MCRKSRHEYVTREQIGVSINASLIVSSMLSSSHLGFLVVLYSETKAPVILADIDIALEEMIRLMLQ